MKLGSACASCFAGLSCQTRIEIINLLKKQKMSVLEIAHHFQVSQPTVSHHLKYLEEAGILSSEKQGRKIFYFLNLKCKKQDCDIFI